MRGWRAWAADGSVYSSDVTRWPDVPSSIVGVVVYLDPPYRRILDGHDWIWMEDGEFQTIGTHEEWGQWADEPESVPCGACVKRGAALPDERWAEVQAEMMEARQWPST